MLKELLHVLKIVSVQREHTGALMQLMLEYEKYRHKITVEHQWEQKKSVKNKRKNMKERFSCMKNTLNCLSSKREFSSLSDGVKFFL